MKDLPFAHASTARSDDRAQKCLRPIALELTHFTFLVDFEVFSIQGEELQIYFVLLQP